MSNNFARDPKAMNNSMTSVVPPIEFPCIVNGRKLSARLTHIEDNPVSFVYYVSFSDGYKTSFYSIEHELGFYEEGKGNSAYAKGIRGDLKSICGFRLDDELYCFPMDESGEGKNVWIKQDPDEREKYSVYTPSQESTYRFTVVRKDGKWLAGHINRKHILTDADNILAANVCKFIDKHRR